MKLFGVNRDLEVILPYHKIVHQSLFSLYDDHKWTFAILFLYNLILQQKERERRKNAIYQADDSFLMLLKAIRKKSVIFWYSK